MPHPRAGIVAVLLAAVTLFGGRAETAVWRGESVTEFGTGDRLYACGWDCAGFTYRTSDKILFFDTVGSSWSEFNLDAVQTFHDLIADGRVVLALSDSLAIAYNSRTSLAHTVRLEGSLLSTQPDQKSWACGFKLAFVVTDQNAYVFDAELDTWREYAYAFPADYTSGGRFVAGADYAVAALPRQVPAQPMNIAYSRPQHAFSQTDFGVLGERGEFEMTLGYAGVHRQDGNATLTGFSAVSGVFDVVTVHPGDEPLYETPEGTSGIDQFYTYAAGYVESVVPIEHLRYHAFGYDTRSGLWTTHTIDYDAREFDYGADWERGSEYVINPVHNMTENELELLIYSDADDAFRTVAAGVDYDSGFTLAAGDVYVVADDTTAHGFNHATGQSRSEPLDRDFTSMRFAGQNYLTFSRWDEASDKMTVYIYHGPHNAWRTAEIWKSTTPHTTGASRAYATAVAGDDVDLFFYSASHNTIEQFTLSAGTEVGGLHVDSQLLLWSNDITYSYRTLIPDIHPFAGTVDFSDPNCLGEHLLIGVDNSAMRLTAYSTVTMRTSVVAIDQPYVLGRATHYVGWVATADRERYYGYGANRSQWREFTASGTEVGVAEGGGIVLVVRSDKLYAFDPGNVTPMFPSDF